MGKHIKEGMSEEEIKRIEEERKERNKAWHKKRYENKKEQYIKNEYQRREKIKQALKLLEEHQGITLNDIQIPANTNN